MSEFWNDVDSTCVKKKKEYKFEDHTFATPEFWDIDLRSISGKFISKIAVAEQNVSSLRN